MHRTTNDLRIIVAARVGSISRMFRVRACSSPEPGLCARCDHARSIESGKGSTFWLCGLHSSDPRFPKYPRLPVVQCPGFSARPTGADAGRK